MDLGAILAQRPAPGFTRIAVDQAVFTSVGTAMGQGYRLIAASGGVRADERQEITQRSPSHAAICSESAEAQAISVYPLRSGRYVIAHTIHAGAEQTERGGFRVHTHVAVLDENAYETFEHNPVRVRDALQRSVAREPFLDPSVRLEALELDVGLGAIRRNASREIIERFLPAAASLLGGQRDVLVIDHSAEAVFEWSLLALPVTMRRTIAASVGLTHSPSRRMQLTVMDAVPNDPRRFPPALTMRAIRAGSGAATGPTPFDPWLRLVARWWHETRYRDLSNLTSRVQTSDAGSLGRVAQLCDAIDALSLADEDALQHAVRSGGPIVPRTDLERELQDRLVQRATQRLAEMEAAKNPRRAR